MKPINEMTPLEIREAVAVEVMGLADVRMGHAFICNDSDPKYLIFTDAHGDTREVPLFEDNVGAAFKVVEKMRENGCDMTLTHMRLPRTGLSMWGCEFNPFAGPHEGAEFTAHGATAALAICKAALEAVRATK